MYPLGAFHIIINFKVINGRRFGSAGLRDVLSESDILATGSVDSTPGGQHYNSGVRAHKLVAEGIGRLRWAMFLQWNIEQEPHLDMVSLAKAIDQVIMDSGVNKNLPQKIYVQKKTHVPLTSEVFTMAKQRFAHHLDWSSYIDIVDLLLQFIRSTKEAGWSLQMQCLLEMTAWFAAYAIYLPAYVLEMMTLPESHPDTHTFLISGEFAVQRSTVN